MKTAAGVLPFSLGEREFAKSPLERLIWLQAVLSADLTRRACQLAGALSQHVNSNTGQCNPSRKRLAEVTNIDPTNVSRALRELRIARFVQNVAVGSRSNSYALVLPTDDGKRCYVRHPIGVTNDTSKVSSVIPGTREENLAIEPEEPPGGAAIDFDAMLYREGRALLGPKSGGFITMLKRTFDIDDARRLIEIASAKSDPQEYLSGALRRHAHSIRRSECQL